ncbi:MAG TPA: nucleotidyltransferase domain-containing protein, partial [Cellvibrio sp.]
GWDLRKALQLLWKSNPAIVEWLQSPIVYVDDNRFAPAARELLPDIYSLAKGIYHYRSMAKTNYRGYLKEALVPIKKYFYVLRPLLAIRWLEQYLQPAPIEFHRLRELLDGNPINDEIEHLLQRKKLSQEKEVAPAITPLNNFIEAELERLEQIAFEENADKGNIDKLNALFKAMLV